MAATGPYILHKSTQLCVAVRSNVNFEQIHPSVLSNKLGMKFNFPDGANTLPPRINLKVLSTAVNVFCEKIRVEREKFIFGRQNDKHWRRRRHHGRKSRPRDEVKKHEQRQSAASEAVLLGAGGFFWTEERITDQDLTECTKKLSIKDEKQPVNENEDPTRTWEVLAEQEHMSVLRRQMETGIYEYKVFGSFCDINAKSFFTIQIDTEYRKVWDNYAERLDIIDRDPKGECEVLHWIMKYPYPLRSRDYVFVRRSRVDEQENKMVLMSKSTSHPKCPENNDHIRVTEYASQMVIKPHTTFDKNGMDFVMSCYDNPKMTIPSVCTNYATASGIPDYINTLHAAARKIQPPEEPFSRENDRPGSSALMEQDDQ